jgi:hypothetical protein
MIKCAQCTEQLSTYLDGIITAEEKRLIEEHLSTCEHCRLSLSELIKTQETLHNLEEVEPPPWFTQKIMNRVREEAESRKGLLQRLFYPFHIKIPVGTLATCLVVVLALLVYKNTGPEIKVLHEPEKTVTASPQGQTQKQDERALSIPEKLGGKSGGMLKEDHEQQGSTISPARPESSGAGSIAKDIPSTAGIPEQQMAEKTEGTGNRYEAKTNETQAMKKQESIPAQKSVAASAARLKEDSISPSVGSAKIEYREAMKAPAAREIKAAPVTESKQVLLTVLTNNIETTAKETEGLLSRFGAKNIKRTPRQPRSVTFDADLPGQKVKEFFDSLKTIGDVKGKDMPSKPPEEYLAVSIEITSNP